MPKFNVHEYESCTAFSCTRCGKATTYRLAAGGCSRCGHYMFRVANRSGTPTTWDRDRQVKDPYLRQKQSPMGNNDGSGYNLTKPFDEDTNGSSGGSRFRGGFGPTGVSATESEYDQQNKKQLPSESTLLDQPPTDGTTVQGLLMDPGEALSSTQQMNRQMSNPEQKPLNDQLAKQRTQQDIKTRVNDNLFKRTVTRLRGVQR